MALGEVGVSEISAILPYEIQSFNIDLTFLWNCSFFHYEPKVLDFKKVFSNLETEGQGRDIIMGVTRLLFLGPFYSIQTNFLYFFAHNCILHYGIFIQNIKPKNNQLTNYNPAKKDVFLLSVNKKEIETVLIKINSKGQTQFWYK